MLAILGDAGLDVIGETIAAGQDQGLDVIGETIAAGQAAQARKCAWYQERKDLGQVVQCQFPSTSFLVGAAAAAILLVVVTR